VAAHTPSSSIFDGGVMWTTLETSGSMRYLLTIRERVVAESFF